jgi:hypothetical protein
MIAKLFNQITLFGDEGLRFIHHDGPVSAAESNETLRSINTMLTFATWKVMWPRYTKNDKQERKWTLFGVEANGFALNIIAGYAGRILICYHLGKNTVDRRSKNRKMYWVHAPLWTGLCFETAAEKGSSVSHSIHCEATFYYYRKLAI